MHATENTRRDLVEAFVGMASEINRPRSIRWRLDDAARGRPVRPLGGYPEVAEECVEAGGSFYSISRPLTVMLAHLRRRCTSKLPADLKQIIVAVKKECDEAEAMALVTAFSGELPSVSDLAALDKEAADAELTLARLREVVQERMTALHEASNPCR